MTATESQRKLQDILETLNRTVLACVCVYVSTVRENVYEQV